MKKPLISIIVPVYNTSSGVREAVGQILSQQFNDFELILVDDGSSDDSLEVIREIEKADGRVRVFTKENGGPSSARNVGLEHARGDYIQFYDSDDGIANDSLSVVSRAIQKASSDLVVSGWRIDINKDGQVVEGYKTISPDEKIINSNMQAEILRSLGTNGVLYNLWNKLFRADIIRDNSLRFREDLMLGEDLVFSLKYFSLIEKIDIIPDITYHYQTNSSTSTVASSSLVPEYQLAIDQELVDFVGGADSQEATDLATWLRWRWISTYWSAIAGSKMPFKEKLSRIRQVKIPDLKMVGSAKYIGFKKYVMLLAIRVASLSAPTSLLLGKCWKFLKEAIIFMRTKLR